MQDLGITDEEWDSFNANLQQMLEEGRLPTQWSPNADGTYTWRDDDGSELIIDSDGNIFDVTEAPAGNLPGETPPPAPPAGDGGTPPTGGGAGGGTPPTGGGAGGGGNPTAPTPPTPPTAPSVDLSALLTLMGLAGGGRQAAPQQPIQNPVAEVKSFEEQGFGDIFGTELTFAKGGEIDELLRILRG